MASEYSPLEGGGEGVRVNMVINFWDPRKAGKIYSFVICNLRKAAVGNAVHTAVDRQ